MILFILTLLICFILFAFEQKFYFGFDAVRTNLKNGAAVEKREASFRNIVLRIE